MKNQSKPSAMVFVISLTLSLVFASQSAMAAGQKRQIDWAQLPDLKSENLAISVPSIPGLEIAGLSAKSAEDFVAARSVNISNDDAIRFLSQQKFSAEGSRVVSRKPVTQTQYFCLETPIARAGSYRIEFSLDEWLEEQSFWCKAGDFLFSSCRPESIDDVLSMKKAQVVRTSTQADIGTPKKVEMKNPAYCTDGATIADQTTAYSTFEANSNRQLDFFASLFETSKAIKSGKFSEMSKDRFAVTFNANDVVTLQKKLPDQTVTIEEVMTETRTINSIRIGAIVLTLQGSNWVGTTSSLASVRTKAKGDVSNVRVSVGYSVATTSSLTRNTTFDSPVESKPVALKSRTIALSKTLWQDLAKLAASKHQTAEKLEGPFIVTAGARDKEISSYCDGNGDASIETACYSVVFLNIDPAHKGAEVLKISTGGAIARFAHDFGGVAVQGQDLTEVEGAQIDQYEARLIRSKVTERFPDSQYRYFIDGQSAGDTLANMFGAITIGITLGKFERLMVPKAATVNRFFVEAETVGSIIWIPAKHLVTLQFERIQ